MLRNNRLAYDSSYYRHEFATKKDKEAVVQQLRLILFVGKHAPKFVLMAIGQRLLRFVACWPNECNCCRQSWGMQED